MINKSNAKFLGTMKNLNHIVLGAFRGINRKSYTLAKFESRPTMSKLSTSTIQAFLCILQGILLLQLTPLLKLISGMLGPQHDFSLPLFLRILNTTEQKRATYYVKFIHDSLRLVRLPSQHEFTFFKKTNCYQFPYTEDCYGAY